MHDRVSRAMITVAVVAAAVSAAVSISVVRTAAQVPAASIVAGFQWKETEW